MWLPQEIPQWYGDLISHNTIHSIIHYWFLCWFQIRCLDISPGGALGVSAGTEGDLLLWNTNNGTVRVSSWWCPSPPPPPPLPSPFSFLLSVHHDFSYITSITDPFHSFISPTSFTSCILCSLYDLLSHLFIHSLISFIYSFDHLFIHLFYSSNFLCICCDLHCCLHTLYVSTSGLQCGSCGTGQSFGFRDPSSSLSMFLPAPPLSAELSLNVTEWPPISPS